ncbi:MAG: pyridoxal 5'-phosphate synthase [Saprospiraceae bacterium]
MQLDIHHLREDYTKDSLDISTTADHPFQQFHTWFKEAQASSVAEPNAMTLATVTPEGRPKARIMLLKQLDSTGFVFFTNYGSAKGKDLTHNPQASLLFFWDALQRQVRISGVVERISREESIAYFQSRPKGSCDRRHRFTSEPSSGRQAAVGGNSFLA